MKDKHIRIRINQCLENASASNCTRRKFGALIVDPERNVVLADGYNGGLRNGGPLCANINGVPFCARDGLVEDDFEIVFSKVKGWHANIFLTKYSNKYKIASIGFDSYLETEEEIIDRARLFVQELVERYPKIPSGEKVEIGCVHAEANTIINACNSGNSVKGAWLFINGEPCINCSKLIINSGIERVYVVAKGYQGNNGCELMEQNGVTIIPVEGPQDPRI